MIQITSKELNKKIKSVCLIGHALYEDYGKDIVCAGVSAILTTTVNGILSIQENALKYEQQKDKFLIKQIKEDEITQKLIENMLSLFKELETQYPKNIKVESEEETCL